uniref:RRM domain-containing protein n=1 Tax=Anopheles epiroticus TaxID=199890 RepID=A0A9I3FH50_9DIPT
MTDAEKNAPAATAEEKETTNAENDGADGEEQKHNEHQRTINVGNLPNDVTEQQLRDHFAGHEVERVEIYHYLRNTLALLVFKEKAAAQKACEEKDGSMFNGRRLRIHIEYITIRYTKKDVIVAVVDDDMTEEKLYDRVKEHCEVVQVFIFHPLGYVHLSKDADKATVLEKLNAGGLKAYDVNGRDQNQHVDLWRAAKLFCRNRNRVQLLNIPQKWAENTEELKKACSEAGTITEAISNNVTQGTSNYYARIFFETEEQAAKAAELLNGKVFEGKRIHALHLSSALLPNYKTSVYASPLERTVTEEDVYEHFKQFGEIDFVNRRNCGENAIICFKSSEAAEKAVACTTFPAPTEENKEATKTIAVKRYDGPLVLRAVGVKRKAAAATTQRAAGEGKTRETGKAGGSDRERSHKDLLQKLQAFYPVYVSNIPFSCPANVIRDFFSSLGGEVKFMFSPQHYLPYRLSSPQPVKTAMVYYTRRNDMMNAIKQLDKKMLNNQHLHVLPGRGDTNFSQQKTVKLSKITESLSEDAIFRKMRPLGKVVRLTKKNRSLAFVEFADSADVEKVLKLKQDELPINCVFSKITKDISRRLYNESDPRILGTVVRLLRRNPKMLNKTTGAGPLMSGNNAGGGPGGFGGGKRPRMSGPPGFGNVPPFNANNGGNNLNNNQAIQDLLRLAFMSGKNVGESLAAGGGNVGGNQGPNRGGGGGGGSFNNADPPISNQGGGNNAFGGGGDGGFGAGGGGGGGRNMNNRNQNMNFRGGNRNNQNSNVGGNRGLGNSSNNAGGGNNNFGNQNQNNSGSAPRGGSGGALGGGNNSNSGGGGMMNNRNNMNNMNNRNNSNNMNMNNKRTGGGNNLQQQNSALQAGGVVAGGGGGNMNKGSGGMRGNNNQGGMGGGGSGMGGGGAGGNMNMNRSNNNMGGGMGGGNNRNNRNNFNDNSSFGGAGGSNNNSFGSSSNNFSNDNFGGGGGRNNDSYSNDNFGGGRNDSYSSDNNFGGGNSGGGGRNSFGNRNNDNYGSNRNDSFGGGGNSSNFGGGNSFGNNSRFNNDNDGPFGGNSSGGNNTFGMNNRGNNSSNSRFSDDNIGGGGGGGYGGGNSNNRGNNFNDSGNFGGGNSRGSGGNQKPQGLFNLGGGGGSGGGNLGGGGGNNMYNNFGGGNSNNSGGNNFRNNDNNKGNWNNSSSRSNSSQDNIGRLAGSLFSRRF